MNKYDSTQDTTAHIVMVGRNIDILMREWRKRKMYHDQSKLHEPEKIIFDEVTPKLKSLTYGSPEYKLALEKMGPALDHHYRGNRHHPEHFAKGIRGMTLVDLVEMFADWMAATQRHADGDAMKSIEHNEKRFETGPVLRAIFENTVRELYPELLEKEKGGNKKDG